MTKTTAVVRPLPGSGLVARAGDLLLVCADGGREVDDLLGLVAEVAAADGDGGVLVRRVAALLAADFDGSFPACAASGPTRDGRLAVLVYGAATAAVVTGDGDISLAGSDAITSVNRLIAGPVTEVRLGLPGAGPADPRSRLDSGVVAAGGVVYSLTDVDSGPSAPASPDGSPLASAEPVSSFGAAPAQSPPSQSAPSQFDLSQSASSEPISSFGSAPAPVSSFGAAPAPVSSFGSAPTGSSTVDSEPAGSGSTPVESAAPPAAVASSPSAPAAPAPVASPAAAPGNAPPPAPPAPPAESAAPSVSPVEQPVAPVAPVYVMPLPPVHVDPLPPPPSRIPDAPVPADPAADASPQLREPDPAAPFVAVLLVPGAQGLGADGLGADGLGAAGPNAEAVGTDSGGEAGPGSIRPTVLGVLCANGHFCDPNLPYCGSCGVSMDAQTLVMREGPRPPLGVLVLDDGMTFRLDVDYVVGREPQADPEVVAGTIRPLRIGDAEGVVSRRHLRVTLVGWDVQVVDLGSANGTYVDRPGDPQRHQLIPNQPIVVRHGTQVTMGRRWFRYESYRNP
jgi:FHA domain